MIDGTGKGPADLFGSFDLGFVGPGEDFAFYSEIKENHKRALRGGGMGFDLNVNRIPLAAEWETEYGKGAARRPATGDCCSPGRS